MADFQQAYQIGKDNEDGWVNDPYDAGGETYAGVASNNAKFLKGWLTRVDRFQYM